MSWGALSEVDGRGGGLEVCGWVCGERGVCVCGVVDVAGTTVPSISHQLAKLRAYGFIGKRREGQTIYYHIVDTPFMVFLKQLFFLEDYFMNKAVLTTSGSILSAFFASLCCFGPVVLSVIEAGRLCFGAAFDAYLPYFIAFTVLFFYPCLFFACSMR